MSLSLSPAPSPRTFVDEKIEEWKKKPTHERKDGEKMVNITDEEFVDGKFHENREEDGGIKVTEEIKSKYGNMEYLEKIHVEDGWGTEEGKLYTPDMTGCLPHQEEVLNLSMKGYIVRGRIVCQRGIVMNMDLDHQLATLGPQAISRCFKEFNSDIEDGEYLKSVWTADSYTLSEKNPWVLDENFCPPVGEYTLKEKKFEKKEEGFTAFAMCDNPKCLIKSAIALNICAMGLVPEVVKGKIMDFIKTREIYTKKDDFYGNTDICQLCFENNMEEPRK